MSIFCCVSFYFSRLIFLTSTVIVRRKCVVRTWTYCPPLLHPPAQAVLMGHYSLEEVDSSETDAWHRGCCWGPSVGDAVRASMKWLIHLHSWPCSGQEWSVYRTSFSLGCACEQMTLYVDWRFRQLSLLSVSLPKKFSMLKSYLSADLWRLNFEFRRQILQFAYH